MELNNMATPRAILEQLSTEKLDEMLDRLLHTEPIDDNSIRLIMDILRERDKAEGKQIEMTPQLEAAWAKYKRDTEKLDAEATRAEKRRRWVLRAASAAAVLVVLLFTVIPQQASAESLWAKLARWTASIVEFFSPDDNQHRIVEYQFTTDNPGLQEVYDTAVEMGVPDPMVLMWLPEGNELVECKVSTIPSRTRLYSRFAAGDSETVFVIDVYNEDVSHEYHKDETAIETYELRSTLFDIMRNNDVWIVVWKKENTEYSIAVDCEKETLYKILASVYSMEVK